MHCLSALTLLPADDCLGAFNELEPHLSEEASDGADWFDIIIMCPEEYRDPYLMVLLFDQQCHFQQICGLYLSASRMDLPELRTTQKHGRDGEIK
jgi:hypothetical protein